MCVCVIYHTSMNMYHSFNSSWVFLFSCYAADLPFWYISIISKIRMYSSNRKLQEELEICYYLRLRIFRVVGCVPAVWTLTAWLCESWHRAQTRPRNTRKVRPSVQGPPLSLFWCILSLLRLTPLAGHKPLFWHIYLSWPYYLLSLFQLCPLL